QVVGEGIVVVEKQQHFSIRRSASDHLSRPTPPLCAISSAFSTARALFADSSYSRSGTESATIPAPACTYARPFFATKVRRPMHESRLPEQSRYRIAPA